MSGYLVDASVWAEFLRGGKAAVRERVEKLLDGNRAAVTGVVLAELLAAIGDEKERRFLEECLLGLPFLEADRAAFAAAGRMGAALREKGIPAPLSGLLLLALARAHGLTVLTLDGRLPAIARPLGVRVESLKGHGVTSPVIADRSKSINGR